MNENRRKHIRVSLSVRAALFFDDRFLFNVPTADISDHGIRLEIPIVDESLVKKRGVLKLFFQPDVSTEVAPYVLEMPFRFAWTTAEEVGVVFLDPDPAVREKIGHIVHDGHPAGSSSHGGVPSSFQRR